MKTKTITLLTLGGLVVLLVTMALAPPVMAATYEASLAAYWNFNEASGTIYDQTTPASNSTSLYGTILQNQTAVPFPEFGKSINTASGGGARLGQPAELQVTNFTVSAWVKASTLSSYERVFSKQNSIQFGTYNSRVYGAVGDGSGFRGTAQGPATLNTGNWYFLTMTYDNSTKQLKLYTDGAFTVSATSTQSIAYNASYDFSIGYYSGTSSQFFRGNIDELGVWNAAKSDAEVYSLYINGIHPVDIPSRAAEINGYLGGSGLTLTQTELNAIADAAINDAGGTVRAISGNVYHYEPVLAGSSGSYYYDFSLFPDLAANSWAWGTGPGKLANYASLNDWYAKVATGALITADGDAIVSAGEAWALKTGGVNGTGGSSDVPEIPAGLLIPLLGLIGGAMIWLRKKAVVPTEKK